MNIKRKYFFIFKGETPAKKNSRRTLRNGKTIPSRRFEAWHADSLFSLLHQKRPAKPIDTPICITMVFCHGDRTRRDSDNEATSILDLLQDGIKHFVEVVKMRITIFIASLGMLSAFIPQFIDGIKSKSKNIIILRSITLFCMCLTSILNLVLLLKNK